jgi:biotin transport system permease protein
VATLVLSLVGDTWQLLVGAGAVTLALLFVAGLSPADVAAQLWQLRWLLVIMLVPQLIFLPWQIAVLNTGRVLIVVLLAALLTLTTPMSRLMDLLERMLAPLRPLGGRPDRVALVLSLTIATVPVIAALAGSLREALIARGRRGASPRILMPLLVLTLQHGDQLADAMRARGLD